MKKIITIAALAMAAGGSPAAKLCIMRNSNSTFNSVRWGGPAVAGGNDGVWVMGINCGDIDSGQITPEQIPTICQSRAISGIARCSDLVSDFWEARSQTIVPPNPSGKYCWGKMTWPVEGFWIPYHDASIPQSPFSNCANQCAREFPGWALSSSNRYYGLFFAPKF